MKLKKCLSNISCPEAEWIGLREVWEQVTEYSARNGHPSSNKCSTSHGVMVEVLKEGCIAYSATTDLSTDSIQLATEQALELAKLGAKYKVHHFTVEQRPATTGHYASPLVKEIGKQSPSALNDFLISACHTLKEVSPKIQRSVAGLVLAESKHRFVSTAGADREQDFSFVSSGYEATAIEGPVVQSRTYDGFLANSVQSGLEALDEPFLTDRLRAIGEEAVELLSAEECPTSTIDLVLMPSQMGLQIHESIGHPLEIDRILGDERNYAGSSFLNLSDFGTLVYGSPLMNVSFDPTNSKEFASYGFDDNGCVAKKKYLIKAGKLLCGLGGLESQVRSRLPGVASARASLWNRPPIDRMGNINLEPGDSSYKDIIASVERGVLMEATRSWSIDDFRRKFQFGCEYGKLIENGKITKTVRNPNYRDTTVEFWKKLKMLGDASTVKAIGTPHCGKGEPNQSIRVGHASPVCLFEGVEVFGGAK